MENNINISLRDYFAAKVLEGFIGRGLGIIEEDRAKFAKRAYMMADEMMKERSK